MGEPHEHEKGRRAVVPRDCVSVTSQPLRVAPGGAGPAPQPTVQLLREGNLVRAIEITCTCGERIRLQCVYD